MLPQEIIRRKRDRLELTPAEIGAFVAGLADGRGFSDAQVAALAMAMFLNGLSREETVRLTLAMRDSGDVLDWSDLPGPVTDKHSTGGVGDNVSLMLAPIVAACGAFVPMISGRGLGHTGGTLDKMEAIPGYSAKPDTDTFRRTVREVGCAIIGQTGRLAPADGRFYAIRDVTGTVESVPLITASILSKKLAAGLGSLVLDVKAGNGAFMAGLDDALALARSLVEVARGAGLGSVALVTDMGQPLASAAGNALEVLNAIDFLTGKHRDPRLERVTLALAGEMLLSAGLAQSSEDGQVRARGALHDGEAADRFGRMVHALGGPGDLVDKPAKYMPAAPVRLEVRAGRSGVVTGVETRTLGLAVVELGGGRTDSGQTIDPSVGLSDLVPIGARVAQGDVVAMIHARTADDAQRIAEIVAAAYTIDDAAVGSADPVLERIS